MLRFFYGLESHLLSDLLGEDVDIIIEYIVQLHAVADKYDDPVLRAETLSWFEKVMTKEFCMDLWSEGKFPKVMAAIYESTPEGSSLRAKAVEVPLIYASVFKKDGEERFKEMLEAILEYAIDITLAHLTESRATKVSQNAKPHWLTRQV